MTNEEILKVLESLEGFKYRNVYTEEQIEKDRNSLNKLKEQLRIGGVSNRFSYEDMIEASRYGYNYRDTTQFPEMDFDKNCKNNTKQWLTKFG